MRRADIVCLGGIVRMAGGDERAGLRWGAGTINVFERNDE
jgi:hypothetical protein